MSISATHTKKGSRQMFWAIHNTIWWTPKFKWGYILIILRKQYDAMFLYWGGRHIDIATIYFGLIESSHRKMSKPR